MGAAVIKAKTCNSVFWTRQQTTFRKPVADGTEIVNHWARKSVRNFYERPKCKAYFIVMK